MLLIFNINFKKGKQEKMSDAFIVRKQVRELNKRTFANDMVYSTEDSTRAITVFNEIVAKVIQNYDAKDALAALPTIIEIKEDIVTTDIVEKVRLLNPESVYIQINNRVLDNASKREIVEDIREMGYKLIIELNEDDTVFTLAQAIASIVKFDVNHIPTAIIDKNIKFKCKRLASGVDNAGDYSLAEAANVELYEGTYIGDVTELKLEANKHSNINFIEVLGVIHNEKSSVEDIARVLERDSLLASQVIRLSNSAYFSTSMNRIESVKDAVVRIGLSNLKNWLFMLNFSKRGNAQEDVLQASYQRAIFCREVVQVSKVRRSKGAISIDDAYLIGLFSYLDILSGQPLENVINSMKLRDEVKDGLLYREGIGGILLNMSKAYDEADWPRVDKYIRELGIKKDKVSDIYMKSLDEVNKVWKNLTQHGDIA